MTARIDRLRKALENPEVEARRLDGLRRAWELNRDRLRETLRQSTTTPEALEAHRAGCKASWSDPEIRARRLAGIRKAAADPKVRAAKSAGMARRKAAERAAAERRERARSIVLGAGLPALKKTVDFAEDLLARGASADVVAMSLRSAA